MFGCWARRTWNLIFVSIIPSISTITGDALIVDIIYTYYSPYTLPLPQSLLGYSLLQMLELAVAEIHNQDEHVWNMKQDEHNQPI